MKPSDLVFVPQQSPGSASGLALVFAVRGTDLLVETTPDGEIGFPEPATLAGLTGAPLFTGVLGDRPCWGAALNEDAELPPGLEVRTARSLLAHLDHGTLAAAGQAVAMIEWDTLHRFCGRCATALDEVEGERARRCLRCRAVFYPRIAPAVAVLIRRGHEVLLARNGQFPPSRFSVIAGFVEMGETLEAAARREVREEVGVEVTNLRYFESQPWPLGRSLMVAFSADYAGGEICPDGNEIVEARWFTPDALPDLPRPISITRRLIDAFTAGPRA